MKYYKITIEELTIVEGKNYPDKIEVFTQIVSEEDMTKERFLGIIKAVNDLPDYKTN